MKKNLPLILVFALIVLSALHRGGISFQTHLLWVVWLMPIFLYICLKQKNRSEGEMPSLLIGAIMLFLLSAAAGWANSTMQDFGLVSITTLLAGIATLLITAQINIGPNNGEKIFEWLSILATGLSVFGIVIYAGAPIDRLSSTFSALPFIIAAYPNGFALFLIALLPYMLYRFSKKEQTKNDKIAWLIIVATNLISLLLTFSRGGMIVAALIVIYFIWKKILRVEKMLIVGILAIILCVGFIQGIKSSQFKTNEFEKKLTLQSDEKNISVDSRVNFWKGSIKMIMDRPLTGFGPDTFPYAFPKYQDKAFEIPEHPHNMFLKQAVDFGSPSAILYGFILGYILWIGYKSKEEKEFIKIIIISVCGIIGHNIIDYNLNFTANAILLWLELGITVNIATKTKEIDKTKTVPPRILLSITALITAILFATGVYEIFQRVKIVKARDLIATEKYDDAADLLNSTHPIFFEDAVMLKGINAENLKNFNLEKNAFTDIVKRNTLYADALNKWAEVLIENKNYEQADVANKKALEIDSLNDLIYHLDKLKIAVELKKYITEDEIDTYVIMLKSYSLLLRNNAHGTVTTTDPSSAIKMTYILEMATKEVKKKIDIANLRKEMVSTAIEERTKFFNMFLIPLNPL